ncbi:hypothetical protein ABZP36_031795 [Zizania latifolia]
MDGAAAVAAFVLLAITRGAAAQSPGPADEPLSFADLISISVFISIFFPVFIVVLAFTCLRLFRPPDDELALVDASEEEGSRRPSKAGLDAVEIAALPLVSYRDVKQHRIGDGRDDALDCAVCLLEFDDDDALRLLPTCPHAFHPECIGLWFEMHVTCPLCRANVLDALALPPPTPLLQETTSPPDSPPIHETVVLIGDASANEEADERIRIQGLARMRRAAGRQALPRSNSTGHARAGGMERFALRLPEHVRLEILISHRLRHVTSAVAPLSVREGSAHDVGAVRSAVSRLLSLFVPGAGWKGDDEGKSGKAEGSSPRRRGESARGGVVEEKRSD